MQVVMGKRRDKMYIAAAEMVGTENLGTRRQFFFLPCLEIVSKCQQDLDYFSIDAVQDPAMGFHWVLSRLASTGSDPG
jgi:hypothetical protein